MGEILNNTLYVVVLPLIHLGNQFGLTEQVITLMPDRNLASSLFPDEVDTYILTLKNRVKYLTGGHVTGYDFQKQQTGDGRFIVRVIQHVG